MLQHAASAEGAVLAATEKKRGLKRPCFSDACYPCNHTYSTHPLCGSTAAYLLSSRGAIKMANLKAMSHIDMHTSTSSKFRKYRSKLNLFWTDETNSDNRIDSYNFFLKLKSYILTKLIPLRGEKTWDNFLNFKILRLPAIDKELTANQIFNYFFAYLIFRKLWLLK